MPRGTQPRAYYLFAGKQSYPLLYGDWVIGRSRTATIPVTDASVSREHAVVHVTPQGITVEDLGSRNGTRVNGEAVNGRAPLQPGDHLQAGNVTFVLSMDTLEESGVWAKRTAVPEEPLAALATADLDRGTPAPSPPDPDRGVEALRRRHLGGATPVPSPPEEMSGMSTSPRGGTGGGGGACLLVLRNESWSDGILRAAKAYRDIHVISCGHSRAMQAVDGLAGRGVLLLDVGPPEPEGRAVLEAWRKRPGRNPVLIAHTVPEEAGVVLARDLDVDGYVRDGRPSTLVMAQVSYLLRRKDVLT